MASVEVTKWRAEIIEATINIETLINGVICQHYFGHVPLAFFREVLLDEQFSFGLRRRILDKLATGPDAKARIKDLHRINTIRNYFAHCGPELTGSPLGSESIVLDPRKPSTPIDFSSLREEFFRLSGPIEEFLGKLYTDQGGKLLTEPPGTTHGG